MFRGDPSLVKAECFLKTLEKTWDIEDQGFLLEFQNYEMEVEDEYEMETKGDEEEIPMFRSLLKYYAEIFETPKKLPPKRAIDHRILTLPDRKPINVRPSNTVMCIKKKSKNLWSRCFK